jgi:4-amino-4-deoxy-L-arabinose transferase-like glycosyltransferase
MSKLSMRSPWFICICAFLLRVLAIGMVQGAPGKLAHIWESGPEIVNIATAISSHRGFSSPFGIETGPTAWIPPVYPGLLAGIFLIFGQRSVLAAATILIVQAILSSLTCIPLYAIAKRAFDERSAVWSTWAWALFPYEVVLPGLFVWETCLSGFLAVSLCYLSTSEYADERWGGIWAGVLWGIAALNNAALLSLMPVFLFSGYGGRRMRCKGVATVVLVTVVVICPWTVRNWAVFRTLVPLRSNFGEELWKGNHPGGLGRIEYGIGPADNVAQRERYQQLGEIAYVRQRRWEALQFIRQSPIRYARLVLYRVEYWWFAQGEGAPIFIFYRLLSVLSLSGMALAWRRWRVAGTLLLFGAVVVYPLVYYLTDVYARYRYPIEPFLMVFVGYALSRVFEFRRSKMARF